MQGTVVNFNANTPESLSVGLEFSQNEQANVVFRVLIRK
jgi:hypothetical protein